MIQTQKRQRAALPHTALPRRGPARPAGRQNAIEYREEYIDGDGDDETKLEEIPCSYCAKIVQSRQYSHFVLTCLKFIFSAE